MGVKPEPRSIPLTEEVFQDLVDAGQKEGTLEESEKSFIQRVFRFGDQTVKNIMTPGPAVFALSLSTRVGEAIEALGAHRFSRVPVYRKNPQEVVGVLYAKDLLKPRWADKKIEDTGIRPFLRKPYFVPLTKKLDDLLRDFQKQRIHFAVVVDEFGGMAGIVTLEDLLEELFGEIYDELDSARQRRATGKTAGIPLSVLRERGPDSSS
jgi:putative hemolysin